MSDGKNRTINGKILIKSSFWYIASNFLTRAVSFITIPIFTRLMTKQQYGDFSVFASWQSIFLIICGVEIYATLNRARFDYETDEELNGYITSCLVLSTLFTALIFTLYLLFQDFFAGLFLLDRKYIFIMFAYLFTQPVFLMFQAKQRVEYRYKFSAGLSFALLIISTAAAVGLVYSINEDRLLGRILGQYVPYIISGFILYIFFIVKSRTVRLSSWSYALKMGLPLVFSFLGSQILLASDKVTVQHLSSSNEVAWLVLATSCAHIILIFVQSLNNAWSPWFFDKLKAEEYKESGKAFKIYMWFIVLSTFCVLTVGPEIVKILGGKGYAESVYVLPANMLCGVFTALSSQFVNIETYYKKTHYAAILTSIAAVINIAGDIAGVKLFGYQAACYVTVICQIMLIALHYIAVRKININAIIPLKDLCLMLAASLTFIPFFLLLYRSDAVRLGVIIVLFAAVCVLFIAKRRELINILKKYRRSGSENKNE